MWPDRDGNISYLLTICVDGRISVLNNDTTFDQLVGFLLDSPARYGWFGRRFVIMPDHLHIIARMSNQALRLGQWVKAFKAVVAGLETREKSGAGSEDLARQSDGTAGSGDPAYNPNDGGSGDNPSPHLFARVRRTWRWQPGFHDHKFRTPESEARKWEYVCLNPVRYGLVERPELWPFGGEIFYDEATGPRLVRGTPPLLETGVLILEDGTIHKPQAQTPPGGGTRHTT